MAGRSDRHPRVLAVVENEPLGRDRRLEKQMRSLVEAGYRVTVVTRRHPGNHDIPGIDVVEYPALRDAASKLGFVREYGLSFLFALAALVRVAIRPGFDVLQLCSPPDFFFPLAVLARWLGKPTVVDLRDTSPELYAARYGGTRGPLYRALLLAEKASFRSANAVLPANGSFADIIRRRVGLPDHTVTVVGNGPPLSLTTPRPPRPQLRDGRRHLVCWIGAMGPQDRLDLGVRVVHELVREQGRADCSFAFVGDGETFEETRALARELGVEDWIGFPGFLSHDEAFDYLATADVAIDPGTDDTVAPVKVSEYMAFRVPVVAFDLTEVRGLAGEAALYAPPGDVKAMAHLIDELLDRPDLRRRLGAAGRQAVEQRLAWDHQAADYIGVFDRLLRRRPASSSALAQTGMARKENEE